MKRTTQGDLFAIICSISVGIGITPAKAAVSVISPETLTFYLFVFAFGFSLFIPLSPPYRRIIGGIRRDQVWLIMKLSVLFSAAIFFSWTALQYLEPATQSFLSRIKVLMTVFFAIIFLREHLHRLEIIGGIVATLGIALLKFNAGPDVSLGATLMLISAVLFSTAEIMLKRQIDDIPPTMFLFYRNLAMIPCFAVILVIRGESFVLPDFTVAGYIALTSLLGPVIGRGTYIAAIRRNSLSRTVLINQTQPLFAGLAGYVVLSSMPSAMEWIGGGLILLGAIIIRGAKKE